MTEIVICGYARSAFTPAKKGLLNKTRPDDLIAQVIKGLLKKTGVNKKDIEDLIEKSIIKPSLHLEQMRNEVYQLIDEHNNLFMGEK